MWVLWVALLFFVPSEITAEMVGEEAQDADLCAIQDFQELSVTYGNTEHAFWSRVWFWTNMNIYKLNNETYFVEGMSNKPASWLNVAASW